MSDIDEYQRCTSTDRSLIRSDGRTVWVDVDGYTVGRFSRFGIDLHTADDQSRRTSHRWQFGRLASGGNE